MATQNPTFGDLPTASGIDVGTSGNTVSNQAAGLAHDVANKAQSFGDQAQDALADVKAAAQDKAGDLRDQAMKMKDQALDQARDAATQGKAKAADTIHGVADTLRQSASQFGQNQTIAPVGKYANQAADALEDFAGTLRNKDVDQLVTEVSGFVRRNPAIAIGVAVAAGFAITQLLRGGSHSSRSLGSFNDDYAQ